MRERSIFFVLLCLLCGSSIHGTGDKCNNNNEEKKLLAKHMSCFLRPDTGPCRADIIQWYYDVKKKKCYRFFWGGCQGNGNRFETNKECDDYCRIENNQRTAHVPFFCQLAFDYGSCFGHYYRYYWDNYYKTCKRRLYSGCGGNQNNFETIAECRATCLTAPNNTLQATHTATTCSSYVIYGEKKKKKR